MRSSRRPSPGRTRRTSTAALAASVTWTKWSRRSRSNGTDRAAFRPVRTGLTLLHALREQSPARFDWRREPYEFVSDRLAIDLLFGSSRERLALEAGAAPAEIGQTWEKEEDEFRRRRQAYLLYS